MPAMQWPPPEWIITETCEELSYAGLPLARVHLQADGSVDVRTRCYSEGPTHSRRMATPTGGRRYVEAWMRKWGPDVMRDAGNKAASSALEAAQRAALPKVEIKPDPRGPRRGRHTF